METGFKRNLLAELLDSVGRGVLLMALGIGWFVFLWGLNLPALLAGIALGTLLLLLAPPLSSDDIGAARNGTPLPHRWRTAAGENAAFEAKTHFRRRCCWRKSGRSGCSALRPDGALCRQEKPSGGAETLLVQCVRMPPEGELSTGQLVEAHRAMQRQQANRVILCVLGKAPPRVIARAEQMPTPIRVIRRETLLALAGRLSPATDAQLVALGQRKRRTPQRGSLLSIMTQREKAPRYWGYGLFMLILYILTGSGVVRHAGDGLPDAVGRLPFWSGGGGAAVITSVAQSP